MRSRKYLESKAATEAAEDYVVKVAVLKQNANVLSSVETDSSKIFTASSGSIYEVSQFASSATVKCIRFDDGAYGYIAAESVRVTDGFPEAFSAKELRNVINGRNSEDDTEADSEDYDFDSSDDDTDDDSDYDSDDSDYDDSDDDTDYDDYDVTTEEETTEYSEEDTEETTTEEYTTEEETTTEEYTTEEETTERRLQQRKKQQREHDADSLGYYDAGGYSSFRYQTPGCHCLCRIRF